MCVRLPESRHAAIDAAASGPPDHLVELFDRFVMTGQRSERARQVIAGRDPRGTVGKRIGGGLQLWQRRIQLRALGRKAPGRAQ